MFNTIVKELKELYADKKIWIGIITVLIIIIIGTSYNIKNPEDSSSELLKLGVINHDEGTYSDLLLFYFTGSETFSSFIEVIEGESKVIKEAFRQGEIDIYLEIPKDFADNMIHLEHSPIKVTLNTSDTTKAILFQNILKSYEKYISAVEANAVGLYEIMELEGMEQQLIDETNQSISIDLILTALGKETFFSYQPVEQFPATTLLQYYTISILVIMLLYSGLYIGFQVLGEMKQGTFTRLRTTKTPLARFLIAKMLINVIVLAIATAITISVIHGDLITVEGFWFSLVLAMFCVSQAVFLCALFTTTSRFVLVGNLFIFYYTILGGGIIPIQYLPQKMVFLSKLTPNYHMLRGILELSQGKLDYIGKTAFGLFLISMLFFGLAIFLFERRSVIIDEA